MRDCIRVLLSQMLLSWILSPWSACVAVGCDDDKTMTESKYDAGEKTLPPFTASVGDTATCGTVGDRDGDGVERTDLSACEQLTDDKKTFPANAHEDCDDSDPQKSRGAQFYFDGDGDGWGVPKVRSVWGCYGDQIENFATNVDDCDDKNAELHIWKYMDADGDGFGTGEAQCAHQDQGGTVPNDSDCDDGNADVYPSAPLELPLDNVDSNCDGYDYPIVASLEAEPVEKTADEVPFFAIPDDARCQGKALSIAAVEENWDCLGGYWIHIANRGDSEVIGASLELRWYYPGILGAEPEIGDPYLVELPPIGPGEVIRSENLNAGRYLAALVDVGDPGACLPMSDQGRVGGPFVDCL